MALLNIRASYIHLSLFFSVMALIGFSSAAYSTPMSCPTQFHQLPLTPSAGFCQAFDQEFPVSLSYFSALNQEAVRAFYVQELGLPKSDSITKGRYLLNYHDRQLTIVISADGQGSQIDILLKDQ